MTRQQLDINIASLLEQGLFHCFLNVVERVSPLKYEVNQKSKKPNQDNQEFQPPMLLIDLSLCEQLSSIP
uniref:Uncharacterized protein n=1 Tax=Meloidogyne incognita TaxID=6306 RepID=A0A914KT00_MELIC